KQPVTIDLAATPAGRDAPPGSAAEPTAEAGAKETAAAGIGPGEQPAADAGSARSATADPPGRPASIPRPMSPSPPRAERPKTDWSSAGRLIAAGVFGGAIATVLGILYHASGIIPTRADLTAADAVRQAQAT